MLHHPLHPGHPLHEVYVNREFECSGCHTLGHGKCYSCSACTFNLHDHCATCPHTLSSHLHPAHPLALVNQSLGMVCDLCNETVEGLYYTCQACRFYVHPLCAKLPLTIKHATHPHHLLTLRPAEPRNCMVCGLVSHSWRYTCEECRLDIHLECTFQEPMAGHQIRTAPVYTYHNQQYGPVMGVSSASPPYIYPYQPVIYPTFYSDASSASPPYVYPYQPVIHPTTYSTVLTNGGASTSTSGSNKLKKVILWLVMTTTQVAANSFAGAITAGIFG